MKRLLYLLLLIATPTLPCAAEEAPDETPEEAPGDVSGEAPTEPPDPAKPKRTKVALMPSIAYNPDDGLGLGIYGGIRREALPGELRVHVAELHFTADILLKPKQLGWLTHWGLSWFPQEHGKNEATFTITSFGRSWEWWFGLGQDAVRDRTKEQDDDPVSDYYHRFRHFRLRSEARLFRELGGPLDSFFGVVLTQNYIEVREDTLLEEQVAAGEIVAPNGGFDAGLDAGLRADGRNVRIDPTRGGMIIALARTNFAADGMYGRLLFDLRFYLGTGPKAPVVFAGELLGQASLGAVPFYEQGVLAGFELNERALTGVVGLRGLDRGRFRGPLGLMTRLEVRFRPPIIPLFKWFRPRLEPIIFVDGLRVDVPGEGFKMPLLQPGFGGGIRLFVNEVTVARLDFGVSPEPMLTDDGLETRWEFAIYGVGEQAF